MIGLIRGRLVFNHGSIAELAKNMSSDAVTESQRLHECIQEIYEYVNMDVSIRNILESLYRCSQFEAGSRVVLDAVLLSLGKVTSNTNYPDFRKRSIAILPEMRIGTGDGVKIVNPLTHYELWLTGSVDYAILQYVDELDNKGLLHFFTSLALII